MARRRSKRQGELTYGSRRSLPLTHESAQRLPEDGLPATVWSSGLGSGGWGRSPHISFVARILAALARRQATPPAKPRSFLSLGQLSFRAPARVRVCVQRKARREVLFAFNRAGFRGSAPGRYRRTQDSQYSCSRR